MTNLGRSPEVRDDVIRIEGARTNNLRDVTVEIPFDRCTAIIGPSGSGKSSLAFDTLHASAHSAYLDGISVYARFMESRLTHPDITRIVGLRPSIALRQGYGGRSSRSTVGTCTDAFALLRLLYSRFGRPERSAGALSFNHPEGACASCGARGVSARLMVDRLLDMDRSLEEGAIRHRTWRVGGRYWNIMAATNRVPLDQPVRALTPAQLDFVLHEPPMEVSQRGAGFIQKASYEGVASRLQRRLRDKRAPSREYDLSFFDVQPCPACRGSRLSEQAHSVCIGTYQLADAVLAELTELRAMVESITDTAAQIITGRLVGLLDRLVGMGLGYLTLSRATDTLSGGERQRLKIADQVSSPLTGLLYVVDEAAAGLHFAEAANIYTVLRDLVDRGNTMVLVDHAPGALEVSDYVIELGPGGGTCGGSVTWTGSVSAYNGDSGSLPRIDRARRPVVPGGTWLCVRAESNNLRPAEVRIPTERLVVLAGPSGSGKSSLAMDVSTQCEGSTLLSQRDIGATPRSVIATYLGVFDQIRGHYAKASGRSPNDFSFNGAGACPACGGRGTKRIEMQFLEDVVEVCDECEGHRFAPSVLETTYRGIDIAQVLALTIDEAAQLFADQPRIHGPLEVARSVGMGHLVLGQGSDTLSGGEAQRLRISAELSDRSSTLVILDEPTRGLGCDEVRRFASLVDRLLDEGRTVIAIEHHPSIIATADWVIEVGPGAGSLGGEVVASGPPEHIVLAGTLTGRTLARLYPEVFHA